MLALRSLARASAVAAAPLGARGMALGSVKWFNLSKGYGFIQPDDKTQPDIFLHQTSISSNGFRFVKEGERVMYDVETSERGTQAANVRTEAGAPFDRQDETGAVVRSSFGGGKGGGGGGGGRDGPRRGSGGGGGGREGWGGRGNTNSRGGEGSPLE